MPVETQESRWLSLSTHCAILCLLGLDTFSIRKVCCLLTGYSKLTETVGSVAFGYIISKLRPRVQKKLYCHTLGTQDMK